MGLHCCCEDHHFYRPSWICSSKNRTADALNMCHEEIPAGNLAAFARTFIYLFYSYLPHDNYKKIGKQKKKKWRGDLTETIGSCERLGLLEPQFHSNWRKDGETSKMETFINSFHIYSRTEERDWELMTSLSSELKNLGIARCTFHQHVSLFPATLCQLSRACENNVQRRC